ncbi:MAG TPA: polysaccharide deacetylase family protein [Gemmatimonadaceae bacterium]
MKREIKSVLGRLAYATGLYRRHFRGKAVIVLFHRVDDRYAGNPISCTVGEFRAYCDFFRRYFIVVPLAELLAKLERGDDVSRHLVITFDDGYKDNHDVAAVELERRGLPATFFIATNFIGSTRTPWWDADAGITPTWMTWDDVRALHAAGFEIGAHTINHVDLGVVAGDEAMREIAGSGERLRHELGAPVPFFTYPYGRPHQITEENRLAVREAGYQCCLSAFGGTVRPGVDPFRIRRIPISPWFISPYQFGIEAMLEEPE